jgi:hypothetical protein
MPVRATPVHRANHLTTLNNGFYFPMFQRAAGKNTLFYTANHDYIYKPHSGYGQVGTTAASYLASRKRL